MDGRQTSRCPGGVELCFDFSEFADVPAVEPSHPYGHSVSQQGVANGRITHTERCR